MILLVYMEKSTERLCQVGTGTRKVLAQSGMGLIFPMEMR